MDEFIIEKYIETSISTDIVYEVKINKLLSLFIHLIYDIVQVD